MVLFSDAEFGKDVFKDFFVDGLLFDVAEKLISGLAERIFTAWEAKLNAAIDACKAMRKAS